jgi:hypothetical protein
VNEHRPHGPTPPAQGPTDATETAARIPTDLPERLRRWAASSRPGVVAAVQLLVTSRWTADPDFVETAVVIVDDEIAVIDWVAVHNLVSGPLDGRHDPQAQRALRMAHDLAWTGR